jgi:hypothetical protein
MGWPNEKSTKKGWIEYDFKNNFNIEAMYRYYGTNSHRNFQNMYRGLEKKVGFMHGWLLLLEKIWNFYLVKFPFFFDILSQ